MNYKTLIFIFLFCICSLLQASESGGDPISAACPHDSSVQKPSIDIRKVINSPDALDQLLQLTDIESMCHSDLLHIAAQHGKKDIVEFLLDSRVDIEKKSFFHKTALMKAASGGHAPVVELLLQRKANSKAQDCDGVTSLIFAINWGHKKVVELLLQNKASIELADKWHQTPLMWALSASEYPAKRTTIVKLLLDAKANIHNVDKFSRTPIGLAANDPTMLRVLLAYRRTTANAAEKKQQQSTTIAKKANPTDKIKKD